MRRKAGPSSEPWLKHGPEDATHASRTYLKDVLRKTASIVGSAIFLVLAPGFVAALVPWWISHWRFEAPLPEWQVLRLIGVLLLTTGAAVMIDSFLRFAVQGLGTPAPVFPTRHLVVTGLYRYVRNPMYAALVSAIAGQGLLFGNLNLLAYAGIVWLLCHAFVVIYEEPALRASFGAEYEAFRQEVPRWIPRFRRASRKQRSE